MRTLSAFILFFLSLLTAGGQQLPLLKVSEDHPYIVNSDGTPFFWLGGTAWELIHRLTREEVDLYMKDRASKGFTVIQTVILAELEGLTEPNAYGHKPLIDNDPERINEAYFEHVDYVIRKAAKNGMYVGLLPTWGDKFNKRWGFGPEIFTPENAESYGALLAQRYRDQNNIIWILGGDRIPEDEGHFEIIRAMAKGIKKADNRHLITYHPSGSQMASRYFNDDWLDVDMYQSGHSRLSKEYSYVVDSRKITPARPVINGESRYENIPDRFWENKSYGWLDDADVRVSAYWSMIAGTAGYTYGCNDIWQMYDHTKEPTISARTDWQAAIDLPGSGQLKYLKQLFEALPWQRMVHDQTLILSNNPEDEGFSVSAMGNNKDFILAYTPMGRTMKVDITRIDSKKVTAYWYNPRSGHISRIDEFKTDSPHEFQPWSNGWGSDFLLLVVGQKANFRIPGTD